jgi:hypothetical protein
MRHLHALVQGWLNTFPRAFVPLSRGLVRVGDEYRIKIRLAGGLIMV